MPVGLSVSRLDLDGLLCGLSQHLGVALGSLGGDDRCLRMLVIPVHPAVDVLLDDRACPSPHQDNAQTQEEEDGDGNPEPFHELHPVKGCVLWMGH